MTSKLWKIGAGVAVLATAIGVTYLVPNTGLDLSLSPTSRAKAARNDVPYDLRSPQVLERVLLEVKDHYVDPDRIDPQRMLLGALNAIQTSIAPVLVNYKENEKHFDIQVGDQRRQFRLDDVDSPWTLAARFSEIFGFLQENLDDEEIDLKDVEYAATNGLLRSLDPHTVLLTPDVFEEMRTSTRGEFGGLGIVISVREGHLTVIEPFPNTPASKKGLKAGDRISKINDESTLNMPVNEAVDRLRGKPGTSVIIWVQSKTKSGQYTRARKVNIERAIIHIDSVKHRMLGDNVGYIQVTSFQGNTYADMKKALESMHKKDMKGLVLDLRSNPGGLLDQAVKITDLFIPSGSIVATSARNPDQREEHFAHKAGTEWEYPMVVLLNPSSASASEIVSGALKNHDRALIVGQRSFGKGSVQILQNLNDGSALKLTVAQYLTPGDQSIQGVGIVPDVEVKAMTVDREDINLFAEPNFRREADLRSHLTSNRVRESEKPTFDVRYHLSTEARRRLRESERSREDNADEDEFLLTFSRKLIKSVKKGGRRELLAACGKTIDAVRELEIQKVSKELSKLGIDWALPVNSNADAKQGTAPQAPKVSIRAFTNKDKNLVNAGEDFALTVEVTNNDSTSLHRLRARTKSDNPLFDQREFVFGKVTPGETKSWTTKLSICRTNDVKAKKANASRKCELPRNLRSRADVISVSFEEANGRIPAPLDVQSEIQAPTPARFSYRIQVNDDANGNNNGDVQVGERGTVYFDFKNVGKGTSKKTQVNLRNLSGSGILLREARHEVGEVKAGESKSLRMTFDVLPSFTKDKVKLEVSVVDMELRDSLVEKFEVDIRPKSEGGATPATSASLAANLPLFDGPSSTQPLGKTTAAFQVSKLGSKGARTHVKLNDGRSVWVDALDAKRSSTKKDAVEWNISDARPVFEFSTAPALRTRDDSFRLRGTVRDADQIQDLYIFAGARKVHYQSNRKSADKTQASFDTTIPLHGGMNYITLVARESDDAMTRRVFIIRRDAKDGSKMETPELDTELYDTPHE